MLNFQQLHLGISHTQDYREFLRPSDEVGHEQRLEKALIPSCVQRGNFLSPSSPSLPSFPICPKYYAQTQLSTTFVGGES